MQYLTNIDLAKNQLQNAAIHSLTSAPASPVAGQIYYHSVNKQVFVYDGAAWVELTFNANQGGNTLTNLGAPSAATDAATKGYVDAMKTGLDFKDSARVATTTNITLSGTQTIDGVSAVAGDRVLVKSQTDAKQNGLYVCAAGAWSRSVDADGAGEVTPGAFVFVEEGTTNGGSAYVCSNTGTITLGTTNITFIQFASLGSLTAGNGLAMSGNTLSVNTVANRTQITGDAVDVDPDLLPSPASGDANKVLTASGANTASWVMPLRKVTGDITGNNSTTEFTVTHDWGVEHVVAMVYTKTAPKAVVGVDVTIVDSNNVKFTFATAPATGTNYSYSIVG